MTMTRSTFAPFNRLAGVDPQNLRFARKMLPMAQVLLAQNHADFVCLHAPTSGRIRKLGMTAWRVAPEGCQPVERPVHPEALVAEIFGALGGLIRDIVALWPQNARPREIGFATDGKVILFNASHPDARGLDWLAKHISGDARACLLVDSEKSALVAHITQEIGHG